MSNLVTGILDERFDLIQKINVGPILLITYIRMIAKINVRPKS